MELSDYRKDFLENVKSSAAADTEGTVATFVRVATDYLVDTEIVPECELCYYSTRIGRKMCRVDAYAFDDFDCSMSLFIADYVGGSTIERLTKTDAITLFEKLHTFVDGCLNGKLKQEIEISTPAYDLVERIIHLAGTIRKFKFFIVTDKEMSESISSFPFGEVNNIPLEYHIWDMKRFFRVLGTGTGHEPVEIDFREYSAEGLPCIEASDATTEEFKCYLCVIPGNTLADIYDKYGSRLLEGNVRSFLSTKVAVNKKIRSTIIGQDEETGKPLRYRFFAYNNGISATASAVTVEDTPKGRSITKINNLQIVNGGQTTASLSNARFRDKATLEGIFVQVKITEIQDHEVSQMIIPQISRCSNSQNKVSDADFFSNHEFNIRMQQISRRLYAPAVNGAQYETHWFFERSRGQYQQEQSKMTKSAQAKFQLQNPKTQLITKTDLAKIQNSWREYPYYVSMGAQKNFAYFADYIVSQWDKNENIFNEIYFRNTVALAIIFRYIDRMVPKQGWYEKGYKANIVTYSIALLHNTLKQKYPQRELNLKMIWDKQKIPDELEAEFVRIARFVFEHITSQTRPITNVTEWCKKEQCWVLLKAKAYDFEVDIAPLLIDSETAKTEARDGKKDQKLVSGIEAQTEVVSLGQEYWEKLLIWGKSKKLLSEIDISFIMSATKINYGRIPSEKQSQRILNIRARMKEEGFQYP